ncbi:hypothetical protein EfmAA290_22690 [Enterococcus faecium]|nr:hypothetical protein EfmAA290_22690 [Enterococcus faecium]
MIIEGDVLGGAAGLDKVLNKFVIGAMTKHAMERYITPGSLMIVGNRAEVQKLALEDIPMFFCIFLLALG